jgi:hypothetical protein
MEALEERSHSSYSFMTWVLIGGEWSDRAPAALFRREKGPTVAIGQEAGWAPEPVWTQRLGGKVLCLCRGPNLDRPVVQSIARQYTD